MHTPRLLLECSRCARRIDGDLVSRQNGSRPIVRPGEQSGLENTKHDFGVLDDGTSRSAVGAHLHSDSADNMQRDTCKLFGRSTTKYQLHLGRQTAPLMIVLQNDADSTAFIFNARLQDGEAQPDFQKARLLG